MGQGAKSTDQIANQVRRQKKARGGEAKAKVRSKRGKGTKERRAKKPTGAAHRFSLTSDPRLSSS
jgi:hypothetical protein